MELKDNVLSYQNTMQFHLDNMLRDRVIGSIPQFFETLFRVCANKDSLQQISNIFGQKTVKHVSMEFVLSNVPSGLRKRYPLIPLIIVHFLLNIAILNNVLNFE